MCAGGADDVRCTYNRSVTPVPEKVLLAAPRGYCAGVDRAVQTVEHALDVYGPPVYVRKEIVHNKHVVETLRSRGAIELDEDVYGDAAALSGVSKFSARVKCAMLAWVALEDAIAKA